MYKKGDLIELAKVEVFPGQFFGKAGMHGVVLEEPLALMQQLGEGVPTFGMEIHFSLELWWPHSQSPI
jgi:hypothetical protein